MKVFSFLGKSGKILLISILVISLVVFFFISPILEYVIEKNSKQWVGRVITMDDLDLNLLNGKISIAGIKMLEKDEQSVFFSSEDILVNFTLYKFIAGNYTISEVSIIKPYIKVVRSPKGFNFDDLTASDSASVDTAASDPVHFKIENIDITNGHIENVNAEFENTINIIDFKFHSDGIAWDDKGTKADFSFSFAKGGNAKIHFGVDYTSMNYRLKLEANRVGLALMKPYIYDLLRIDDFKCFLSCDVVIKGNANETTDLACSGIFQFDDILMTGNKKDSLIAFKNISIGIDSVNLKNNIFKFSHLTITDPYVLFELYDNESNNFFALMPADSNTAGSASADAGEESTNPFLMMSDFGKQISGSYDMNSYKVDSFLISGGKIVYKDYTLLETFSYHLTDLKISSNTLNSKADMVEIISTASLNYSGKFEASLRYDPKNYKDMDLVYSISGMRISDMSPQSNYYVAYPFWNGVVDFSSTNTIRNMILDSKNRLLIQKIEVGDKIDNKNAMDVPLKLAVALLKDMKGNIDFEIPISGDLNDPEYKIGKVVWQVISNILLKAVTSPYRLIANAISVNEDDIKQINFNYLDTTFTSKQLKSIDILKKVLEKKPEMTVQLAQYTKAEQEQERFASWESRKQFYFENQNQVVSDSLSEAAIEAINAITIRDSLFVTWLDVKLGQQDVYMPIQQKIIKHVGEEKSRVAVQNMMKHRNAAIQNYMHEIGIDSTRYSIFTEQPEKIPASESLPKIHISFGVDETTSEEK